MARSEDDASREPRALNDRQLSPEDVRAPDLDPVEVAGEEQGEESVPQQVALGQRVRDWRTLLSFGVALAVLVVAVFKAGIDWGTTLHTLRTANPALFALAVVAYYASFPIRTHRWRRLMHNANHGDVRERIDHFPLWDLTQILYLSWFVNVIMPLKLGDVYRAYLARRWMGVSLSRTMGALLAERILDLMVLFPLLVAAAFLAFRATLFTAHNELIRYAILGGLALAVIAGAVLVVIWRAGESVLRVLPRRLHDIYRHFRHGAVSAFGHEAPSLIGQTVVVWLLEGTRLACVLWALGLLAPGKIGPAAAVFLALGSSVLTALPLTPGGLGVVDTFVVAGLVLLDVAGGKSTAVAADMLDRLISYMSIAVIGFFVYALSDKAHAAPRRLMTRASVARPQSTVLPAQQPQPSDVQPGMVRGTVGEREAGARQGMTSFLSRYGRAVVVGLSTLILSYLTLALLTFVIDRTVLTYTHRLLLHGVLLPVTWFSLAMLLTVVLLTRMSQRMSRHTTIS